MRFVGWALLLVAAVLLVFFASWVLVRVGFWPA